MHTRRKQLQDAALEYLLEHGVAKLSLRPLAAKLGTSPRMLIFHFKSKEGLLRDVLAELHARLLNSFATVTSAEPTSHGQAPLKRFWNWAIRKKNFRYLRLLYELQIIAVQNPGEYGRYWKKMSMDWQKTTLLASSESLQTEAMATLCIAVFDGLFLELMSTGDRARLTRALDQFSSMATMTVTDRPRQRRRNPAVRKRF
jgi:AcrR family transcriptional regulator